MTGVLDGIRVLDFGRYIAGPWCATLLGDLGAEVIRVEKVAGSEDRYLLPIAPAEAERAGHGDPSDLPSDARSPGGSEDRPEGPIDASSDSASVAAGAADGDGALFLHLGRNKRSLTLDPRADEGRKIVRKLVETADVVVANLPPRGLRAMGLDYESLQEIKPDIVLTTATGFGTGGPGSHRLGFDGVAQASSGAMHLSGPEDEPMKSITPYADFGTGTLAAFGTMAALMHRDRTGEGQHVEASLLGTALAFLGANLVEEAALGIGRVGSRNRSQHAGPADVFRTRDGWMIVQCIGAPLFRRWCRLVDREDLLDDPRFATDQRRGDRGEELSAITQEWCASRTTEEALASLEEAGVPAGPVQSPRQALSDPHIRAMGFFRDVPCPGLDRPVAIPDTPIRFSDLDAGFREPAPGLGEHSKEVLESLGYTPDAIADLQEKGVV